MWGSPTCKTLNGVGETRIIIAPGRYSIGCDTVDACEFIRGSRHLFVEEGDLINTDFRRKTQTKNLIIQTCYFIEGIKKGNKRKKERKRSEGISFTKFYNERFDLFHCCSYILIRVYEVLNISCTQVP